MITLNTNYEVIPMEEIECIKDLCNDLMAYQKSKAHIHPEFFNDMCYKTRMIPSIQKATANHIMVAKDENKVIGYAYSTIASKEIYSGGFATLECDAFFDFDSVDSDKVGCLSQIYIKEDYRNKGIGTILFERSMDWLISFDSINDIFIFVSNGNDKALKFYRDNGFRISHQILEGFITVLRNSKYIYF